MLNLQLWDFPKELKVRNTRGKRAMRVRVTEGLLYVHSWCIYWYSKLLERLVYIQ